MQDNTNNTRRVAPPPSQSTYKPVKKDMVSARRIVKSSVQHPANMVMSKDLFYKKMMNGTRGKHYITLLYVCRAIEFGLPFAQMIQTAKAECNQKALFPMPALPDGPDWQDLMDELLCYFPTFCKKTVDGLRGKGVMNEQLLDALENYMNAQNRKMAAGEMLSVTRKRLQTAVYFMNSDMGVYIYRCILTNPTPKIGAKERESSGFLTTDVTALNYRLATFPMSYLFQRYVLQCVPVY
jgi:hypothetical protein